MLGECSLMQNLFIRTCSVAALFAISFFGFTTVGAYAADVAKKPYSDHNGYEEPYDPYESVNRAIYSFNTTLDDFILKPIAKSYRFIVPKEGRQGVSNILDNLSAPVTLLNALLQGDIEYAGTTFWRFTINSTLGAAGIMDVASTAGMPERDEDFGQTLGVYGAGPGAYIMLPLLGPSSTRDAGGRVVDTLSNPLLYILDDYPHLAYRGVAIVDGREAALDITNEIDRTSLDPYAALRSLYLQNREDKVRNGTPRAPL